MKPLPTLQELVHVILPTIPGGEDPHFIHGETEAQRGTLSVTSQISDIVKEDLE